MSSEIETRRQQERWSRGAEVAIADVCLHELVAEQASRRPDAVAVVQGEKRLRHGELEQRANQLARHLRDLGVGPEVRVGVCLERSTELVVTLLGVLKAGGAYVPLDPEQPAERLGYVLSDSGARLLVTERELLARVSGYAGEMLVLEEAREAIAAQSGERVESGVEAENLAYVIYTSGSTGRPKGVGVAHRGVVNLVEWTRRESGLGEGDRGTWLASVAFDASVWEVWPYLASGGSVHIAGAEVRREPERLRDWLVESGITVSHLTTPLATEVLKLEWPAELELRRLLTGSDRLQVRPRAGLGFVVVNNYGPTEASVISTSGRVSAEGDGLPGIGKPIQNRRVEVLGPSLEEVAEGAVGELYLGGLGLARGYVGSARQTAERFVPDPSGEAGGRLYRTGDLGRWGKGGELEFVGRRDQQVKVRGYRVELGEIEAVLEGCAGVKRAVVEAKGEGSEKRLVAYVVREGEVGMGELREKVRERLPEYMVPAAWVELVDLPVTLSGKVDRRALPEPEGTGLERMEYVAPRTWVEQVLCDVWAGVLGLERLGVRENFFELGGDSILSIQVVSRAWQAGVGVSVLQLFEHQTIEELAAAAGKVGAEVDAEQGMVEGETELTPIQRRYLEQAGEEVRHFNQSQVLEVSEEVSEEALEGAYRAVQRQHDELRLRLERVDGEWRGMIAGEEGVRGLEHEDLSGLSGEEQRAERERRASEHQRQVGAGGLVRAVLFDLGGGRRELLLAVHHLVVDMVSWGALVEDLERASRQGKLASKTTSYRRWASGLREYGRSEAAESELEHWRGAVGATRALPRDGEGENTVGSEGLVSVELGEEETRALVEEVGKAYRTEVVEALLTGLAKAFGSWTGERELELELEGHGREEVIDGVDVTRTVGWFTSVYPVRLALAKGGVGEELKGVKEQLRGVPKAGIGYGVLRYLGTDEVREELGRQRTPEVVFRLRDEAPGGLLRPIDARREHLLEIDGRVAGGRLRLDWRYSESCHRKETIEALAEGWLAALRELVEHCLSEDAGGYTPSDFPLSGLDQSELDTLLGRERGIEDVYPLAPLQEGMLFHCLSEPKAGLYHTQSPLPLSREVDEASLRRAWELVVESHGALRTSFAWERLARPLQVVRREVALDWTSVDWRELGREEQEDQLAEYLRADRERGFDLSQPPLMRFLLVRLADTESLLVWSHHHALFDGWSLPRVLREAFGHYQALKEGRRPRQRREERKYREFIDWLVAHENEAGGPEAYWRERLKGLTSPTPIGGLLGEGRKHEDEYGLATGELGEEATGQLQRLGREQQVTMSTLVQGAWAVLLSRYSGEKDVMYGETVAGRPGELEGVEEMVGMFLNTVPVPVSVDETREALAWLRDLQRQKVEQKEYEYSPLVKTHEWSAMPAGTQLFDHIVVFENYPLVGETPEWQSAGVRDGLAFDGAERINYPVAAISFVLRGRLHLQLGYNGREVDEAAVGRLLDRWARLVEGIAADPNRKLWELPLLGEEERREQAGWSRGAEVAVRERCIHEVLDEVAEKRSDAVAAACGEQWLSYGELDRKANQLGRYLTGRGVGLEARVGVCVRRSLEQVVALWGVLKAGGVYVPLDPEQPAERLSYVLGDSEARVLVTEWELSGRVGGWGGEVVVLEEAWGAIGRERGERLESGVEAWNLAYVIYTSGSTGRPKGVMVGHGGLVNVLEGQRREFGLGAEARVLQFASTSFDAWLGEVLIALGSGGAMELGSREELMPGGSLEEFVAERGVSAVTLPPAGLAEVEAGSLGTVELMTVAGEACPEWLAERWGAGRRFLNLYGPTEGTIWWTVWERGAGAELGIGHPIQNAEVEVRGGWLEEVAEGSKGELYLRGGGLARGYLGRPGLTAERFVPDPWGAAGGRLYRTGDVVRWGKGGELEYVGRADQQVKVRGYRVELGEIESVLEGCAGVRRAVVEARGEGAERRLVAYVVREGEGVGVKELREQAGERLPEYMVPAAWVWLEELPLTLSGKVDRKRLPEPEGGAQAGDEYEGPRTWVEEALCEIWGGVLGVERVSVTDNFLQLGGHSLLANQVISRMMKVFGVRAPVKAVLESPNIAALALLIAPSLESEQGVEAEAREVGRI